MGGSSPSPSPAPTPVKDLAPERNTAMESAAARRARQRRSSLMSSVSTPDTLGSDQTLG